MALTGHFDADFNAFYDAVAKAQVSVKGFDADTQTLNKDLSSMVDEFSGRKIISEATLMAKAVEDVGGVAHLTADELQHVGVIAQEAADKMKAWGGEIPADIQKIADAAKDAQSGWANFSKGFNIKEAISDPLGTAGDAAGAFAESIGPAGVAALGAATGIGAVGAALFELTKYSAEAGARLGDIGTITGIAVPQLSHLSDAAKVVGTDVGTLSNAVFTMQKNMATNPDAFEKGLERINLNITDFKALNGDEQLNALSAALKATEDPLERNAAGYELMGRQFRDLEPALLNLNTALRMTGDIQPWTDEEAKQAEAFGLAVNSIKVHAEEVVIALGRDLLPAVGALVGKLAESMPTLESWGATLVKGFLPPLTALPAAYDYATAALDAFRGTAVQIPPVLDDTAKKLEALKKAKDDAFDAANTPDKYLKALKGDIDELRLNVPNMADGFRALAEVQRDLDPVTQANEKSARELNAAYAELATAGDGWKGTLDTISGAVVESIISYRDAGVSMTALGTIYSDLSATQLAAIEKERAARTAAAKEAQKDLDDQAKLEAKTIDATTKLWDEYELTRIKQMGTVTDIAHAENDKQYNDAAANAIKMGIVDAQYWDALEARWKQKNAAIGVDWASLTKAATTESKAGLQQIADGAAATYQEALKHVGEWSDSSIEKFRTTAEEAQRAADMFGTSWQENANKAKQGVDDMAADTIGQIHAIAAASASATIPQGAQQPYPDTIEGRLKSLADEQARYGPGVAINTSGLFGGLRGFGTGGSGDFGDGTPVMLHGKEAIVPLGADATDVHYGPPNSGGGSGGAVVQNFYITQPLGTPEAIARAVADAQVGLMTGQGVRLPYGQ